MRKSRILAILAVLAFSGTAEAKDLYCLVYSGGSLLGTPAHVTTAEQCRAIAEAAQHAGARTASYKVTCRDKESWSDSSANPSSEDPVITGCH
jgi:hypothetical protein